MLIGLGTYARVGKDTVADFLVREHGFTKVAFADAVRDFALEVDPLVTYLEPSDPIFFREYLGEVVETVGWEGAKEHTNARNYLIKIGAGLRKLDPNIWVKQVEQRLWRLAESEHTLPQCLDIVFPDMRYRNEAEFIRDYGGHTVRIVRPDTFPVHEDERQLDDWDMDHIMFNDGTIRDLEGATAEMLERLQDSARAT